MEAIYKDFGRLDRKEEEGTLWLTILKRPVLRRKYTVTISLIWNRKDSKDDNMNMYHKEIVKSRMSAYFAQHFTIGIDMCIKRLNAIEWKDDLTEEEEALAEFLESEDCDFKEVYKK
ncbi:MAG: hypothetical protein Ta2E_11470 [Mycoplasmoidaceae bacterium]|nr:MAG: hypothetical protein Ta2E_11470 [Mycoplasmoidaceae bacterium]